MSISAILVGGVASTSTLFEAIFDTGTTLTYVETNTYNSVVNAVRPLGSIPGCSSKWRASLLAIRMCFLRPCREHFIHNLWFSSLSTLVMSHKWFDHVF